MISRVGSVIGEGRKIKFLDSEDLDGLRLVERRSNGPCQCDLSHPGSQPVGVYVLRYVTANGAVERGIGTG